MTSAKFKAPFPAFGGKSAVAAEVQLEHANAGWPAGIVRGCLQRGQVVGMS